MNCDISSDVVLVMIKYLKYKIVLFSQKKSLQKQ